MRSLLLLSAVLVAVAAQTPPHMLYRPQQYYVGTDATFSLTTYSSETFEVTLSLVYQQCTCDERDGGRQICSSDIVFAEDTQTTSASGSQATTLRVRLPSLNELESRRYYISIASSEHTFLRRQQLYFSQRSFGSVLVKTDRPIYKPSQTVNICVVYLGATLRPHNADATAEVFIRDATNRQILKTRVVIPAGEGVGCLDIQLSDEPNLGSWSASANILFAPGSNQCQFYFGLPQGRCNFKVDEFVLPRFEVTVEGPTQITRDLDRIRGTVDATYTFGEKVQGTVRLNATLTSSRRGESLVFSDITAPLVNGRYEFDIDADDYRGKVRYRYDPFCVRSSIKIVAEVTESGRNAKQSDSIVVPLVSNPLTVSFDDDLPPIFRPGLPYIVRGQASRADGSPAGREFVQVTVTANNGRDVLVDRRVRTNRSGRLSVVVDVPQDANCLKFTMSPVLSERSCDRQVVCFSPSPMYSPTDSFLQLTHISSGETNPGSKTVIKAESTFNFETLHILVIGQGSLVLHQALFPANRRGGVRSMTVQVPITHEGVPRVKILAVVARDDGELVADLIEIQVSCQLEHEVQVSFGKDEASPGDDISITTDADPGSVVVLGVIDKSLTLLADACKSVDNDNVCGLLRSLTGGNTITSATCSTESESACCPLTCNEPNRRAVSDIFFAAGINLDTNMFRPSPPLLPRPAPFPPSRPFFPGFEFDAPGEDFRVPETALPAVPPLALPTEPTVDDEEEEGGAVRDFFPETWIWEILETNKDGVAVFPSVVPDTITTWNAEAFAINRESGLGISPVAQLTVKKDLFVSLELPFSINFQETVTVTPLVFYFGTNDSVTVRVTVTVDDELELLSSDLIGDGFVQIEQGTGTPFNLRIKPRAIGRLPITICIRDPRTGAAGPCLDAVRKELFVKPGCEKFQLTTNVYAEDSGNHCFNFTLPSCVIPGSAKASISVTGDLISPPDLDNLLVLPYGCGEQNMVRLSLNLVTTNYLKATDQLPEVLLPKIRVNLNTGYQRQLTYLQGAGCFSIWSRGQCSLWLTAFTARYLIEASDPDLASCLDFPEGSELVDPVVIRGALLYLIRQQEQSGRFPVIGRLHNYHLLRRDNFIGLTGYVLITLRHAPSTPVVQTAIQRAEQYIVNNASINSFCNYGLAVATTSLAIGENPQLETHINNMVAELKRRIQSSRVYPGACFLCNSCPGDRETGSSSDSGSCSSRPRREGSASCVETTAYALRALLEVGDRERTVCLAQWLTQVKSASGGFYSSQDTLVALEALGLFAEETFTRDLNKALTVSVPGLPAITHTITAANRYQRRDFVVASVPSNGNCVSYNGSGTAIIQSTLEYYGCNCCDDARVFSLDLATVLNRRELSLSISVRYMEEGASNMVIVDVEIPSGYVFAGYNEANFIQRQETRGANAIFYINEIRDQVVFTVRFFEVFTVEDHQQLPVTVYDYYEPDQIVTRYFLPVTRGTLPSPSPPTRPPLPFTEPPTRSGDGDEDEDGEEEEET